MTQETNLYSELKPEIQALIEPLFSFAETCLKKRGNFVPYAATLNTLGVVALIAADPNSENGKANSSEVLPLIHEALRASVKEKNNIVAIGIAENVTIVREGEKSTPAIKVLFEHKRGLAVALYLPFKKQFIRGYSFGNMFSLNTVGEVNPW